MSFLEGIRTGKVLSNFYDLLANISALPQCKDVLSSFQISDGHLIAMKSTTRRSQIIVGLLYMSASPLSVCEHIHSLSILKKIPLRNIFVVQNAYM